VAGHVHEGDLATGGQSRPDKPEVNGEAAPALFLPAVWLHSGQRADQGALAMVDVTGRRDNVRRHRSSLGLDHQTPKRLQSLSRRTLIPPCDLL
jgi:hypothetical protein